ncbi:MAG: hypothetical protein IKX25_10920 [Bacteroidales bacterium]|nr:hypothetical protein [Bacteroidales bacterium]
MRKRVHYVTRFRIVFRGQLLMKLLVDIVFATVLQSIICTFADCLARTVMTRMGWFTPSFDTADDVKHRLEPHYDILDFHVEGAMLYFRARKR